MLHPHYDESNMACGKKDQVDGYVYLVIEIKSCKSLQRLLLFSVGDCAFIFCSWNKTCQSVLLVDCVPCALSEAMNE